ncbi:MULTISPECIES: metal ABC transporter solute-binding protein, Zn/Mn family [Corynebacterium]|uniref:Manganese ABC transporter substrate-binding lipoprotein n=1 Tax=Corynebacterium ihumii TaxID=1232427 RepID=A0ABY7UF26_9CORY|nr:MULTISPECIES: zinc ABC transporter substrate-binding protein [Corynebacterium]WCZ35239.1 Manganese ABC transporter substrate-binding lipoprotein precursor [Corynebacterium ihumii]
MRNRFHFSPLAAIAATALAGAVLAGCSSESNDASGSDMIATTNVWADVASAVTGEDVDAIITGDAVDPHHYEPSAKDLSRIKEADTVVANGGAYDSALYTAAEQDRIIYAIPLLDEHEAHDHDHAHAHMPESLDELEHAWFAPEKVLQVAEDIADRTGGDASDVKQRIGDIQSKLNAVPHVHIGMTETIAAGLVWGTELHDITPEEYVKASLNHQEPSAAAVAAFLEQIERGELDMLVVNPQSTNSATQRLADAAKAHNVPVVEIRETPPAGQNFLDYFQEIVGQITDIAAHAEPTGHHH